MRMRTKVPVVTLVGMGALLLAALAVIFAPPAQTVYAQDNLPTVEINLNSYNGVTTAGQSVAQYTFKNFQDITCHKNVGGPHHTAFEDPCYHRTEVYERGTTTNPVTQCAPGRGGHRSFSQGAGISKVIRYGQNLIPSTCPAGLYTLKVILMGSNWDFDVASNQFFYDDADVVSHSVDFEVVSAPTPEGSNSNNGGGNSNNEEGSSNNGGGNSNNGGGNSNNGGGNSNNGGGNSNNGGGNSNNGGGNSNNGGGNSNKGGGNPNTESPPQTFFRSAPPQTSAQQQSSTPIAITLPEIMNVRSGPGLEYEVVATVAAGTQARIIGIGAQDDWYQVEIDGVEGPVWIYQDLTTLSGSLVGVRRYTSAEIALLLPGGGSGDGVPLAITVPITMNVRSGPGLTYDVVRVVPAGTQGPIYGIDPDDEWFQIELDGLDTLAWVYQDLTTVVGSLAGVRRITEQEIAMLPAAVTQPQLLNVRSGPGTDYDVLAIVPQGTWARIIGIDTQAEWYQVELAELEEPAWLFRGLTKVAGGSLAGLIQIAVADGPSSPSGSTYQELTNSITVDLAFRQAGGVNLEVSWSDSGACTQLYNLYHRPNVSSDTYLSLETAATASTTNSKSLSFQTLSGSSFISAWCGTKSDGRQVAEVEIDPGVAGTYSSTSPASDGIAAVVPPR